MSGRSIQSTGSLGDLMKVQCRGSRLEDLSKDLVDSLFDLETLRATGAHRPRITAGKKYTVYGISCGAGNIWFDIVDDDEMCYTVGVLAVFFTISDSKPSKTWVCHLNDRGFLFLWPPSWLEPLYHDRLTDGDPEVVADFGRVKAAVDSEVSTVSEVEGGSKSSK